MSGNTVVLPCPIQPGALLQQYSVVWRKGDTRIVEATNPQDVTAAETRYNIDRATYSLIIDSVNINDTSSGYRCELSVANPTTNAKTTLQLSSEVSLSFTIIGKCTTISEFLLIARIIILGLVFVAASVSSLSQSSPAPYEMIHQTDTTTEQTGSIILKCRDNVTTEELDINEISFFLNRSSVADPSLRERGDIAVVEVGSTGIKFNLTRRLEGNYTCGKRVDVTNVRESVPRTFVCKCNLVL